MAKKPESIALKSAIHKLQLSLLEGIHHKTQLISAGSLLSRSDYEDVATERSISNLCGYPLCSNPLPSDRHRKSKYRISLKEHKVYDLHETYLYCCTACVVDSRTFAEGLEDERTDDLDEGKIGDVLKVFGELSLRDKVEGLLGKNGDLGFGEWKIEENLDVKMGELSLKDWIGPSNAIEGYVPMIDRSSSSKKSSSKNESKPRKARMKKTDKGKLENDLDFTSTLTMGDQFNVSELSSDPKLKGSMSKLEEPKGDHFINFEASSVPVENGPDLSSLAVESQFGIPELVYDSAVGVSKRGTKELKKKVFVEKMEESNESRVKSSLKCSSGAKKLTRSVTWADQTKSGSMSNGKLCEVQEIGDMTETAETSSTSNGENVDGSIRLASAEACALALSQAAEAVASGEADVTDAVSKAGIVIFPQPNDADRYSQKDEDMIEADLVPLKWPKKPGILNAEVFCTEDSWYDPPPKGFSLTLSSFATMYMTLFGWITSSSLAYIYGHDGDSHEEFLSVGGREYPRKIVLSDGRSSEIKLTMAGCLGRALPEVATDLRLKTSISTIEKEAGHLLSTMSFVDALPPFKLKHWHVVALLFMDALSVCRIPGLALHITSGRILLQKVLDGAQVSGEEYETMKDLLLPLGRVPQFSSQSGA